MRLSFFYGLLLVLAWGPQTAHGTVRIANDPGGLIGDYIDKYDNVNAWGQDVMIDGPCLSACTIVLAKIPHSRICTTSRAVLGFHSAWSKMNLRGQTLAVTDPEATQILYDMYPSEIRHWIAQRGGLPPPQKMLYLRGRQLAHMYHRCLRGGYAQSF